MFSKIILKFQVKWISIATINAKTEIKISFKFDEYLDKPINPPTEAVEKQCITAEKLVRSIKRGKKSPNDSLKAIK